MLFTNQCNVPHCHHGGMEVAEGADSASRSELSPINDYVSAGRRTPSSCSSLPPTPGELEKTLRAGLGSVRKSWQRSVFITNRSHPLIERANSTNQDSEGLSEPDRIRTIVMPDHTVSRHLEWDWATNSILGQDGGTGPCDCCSRHR
jgi:hypothetical protein